MIAQKRRGAVLPRQIDYLAAIGAAVDQIAQQNEPVLALQIQFGEELRKFPMAAMDVSNGDKASSHWNLLALT